MTTTSTTNPPRILAILAHPDDEAFGMGGTLALYAQKGARVDLVCATLGEEGDVRPEFLENGQTVPEVRKAELLCSTRALGINRLFLLGYRDSGMAGSPSNQHPDALAARPLEEIAGRIEAILAEVKPDVVLTFDPVGGYKHPDHIRIHEATVLAFLNARKALDPANPQGLTRLLFHTMPKRIFKLGIFFTRLQGQDPRKAGANGDIDLVDIASQDFPTHYVVNYKQVEAQKNSAAACHASQGGGLQPKGALSVLYKAFARPEDRFMQGWPAVEKNQKIKHDILESR